jgi:hypothetical protein
MNRKKLAVIWDSSKVSPRQNRGLTRGEKRQARVRRGRAVAAFGIGAVFAALRRR